jgi:hypothetical protein
LCAPSSRCRDAAPASAAMQKNTRYSVRSCVLRSRTGPRAATNRCATGSATWARRSRRRSAATS